MATKKKVKNGGFPAKFKALWSRLVAKITILKAKIKARKHIKNMKVKKQGLTQAEQFVQSRNASLQYAIDVLALAFILALLFTLINHIVK